MKQIKIIFLFLLIFFISGFKFPDKPDAYINDYAELLQQSQREFINNKCAEFENQTSTQIFIAIFKSLEGGSLEDVSIKLAEKWKPGQQKKDNGVLITVFLDDRAMRIEVGYGLEGVLTDAVSAHIIRNVMTPAFRNNDYFSGLTNAVDNIIAITKGEFSQEKIRQINQQHIQNHEMTTEEIIFVIVFIIILAVVFIKNPQLFLIAALTMGSGGRGGRSSGGGGFGGFRGGGGGSFGGGGASGSW